MEMYKRENFFGIEGVGISQAFKGATVAGQFQKRLRECDKKAYSRSGVALLVLDATLLPGFKSISKHNVLLEINFSEEQPAEVENVFKVNGFTKREDGLCFYKSIF